jgi:peroxiredoxin
MSPITIGQAAPPFRLPSAQGPEVALADYRGRANVILIFAKGMACGFCRQKISQLARGAPAFRALDAEPCMIAPTTVERGRFYARNFQLPFPYLLDPEYEVYRAYGLKIRMHSLLDKAKVLVAAVRLPKPETEFGPPRPALREIPKLLNDDELGFFVVDKTGVIRDARVVQAAQLDNGRIVAMRSIPGNDEIVRVLERCQTGADADAAAGVAGARRSP